MAYEPHQAYLKFFDREQSPQWLNALAARAGAQQSAPTVYVDLGCAAGHSTLALAPLYPETEFIGIDFNAGHIADANAEARRLGLRNARYIHADFRALPVDLPPAQMLAVRGIYSWLAPEVRSALEHALTRVSAPRALLYLHHSVLPGGIVRDALGEALKALGGPALQPAQGREVARLMQEQAPVLHRHMGGAARFLQAQREQADALWVHDLLNEDFRAEYAGQLHRRLADHGWTFCGASAMQRNLPLLLVNEPVRPLLTDWHGPGTQTLLDVLTFNDARTDVFVRGQAPCWGGGGYPPELRFGLIVPDHDAASDAPVPNGTLKFVHPAAAALLALLRDRPRTVAELRQRAPKLSDLELRDWLDLLWAGGKAAPFLPLSQVARVDRSRLRRINRERLGWALQALRPDTRVPLLAAEYGNCLIAGWFECLVLAHFDKRRHVGSQRQMLGRMHRAGMRFRAADGQVAEDQLKALQEALDALEDRYLSKMGYWGIEV